MSDDFKAIENFIDPLDCEGKITFSSKFVCSIFNPEFIKQERQKSENTKTIVFDLDETMRGWDDQNHETFLRHSLKKVLSGLIKKNYRLIIWSSANQESIQQTLNKYPEFEEYFDLIISAESFSFKFASKQDQENLKKIDLKYYDDLLKTRRNRIDEPTGRSIFRTPKNITLLGYNLIIDDDPAILDEGIKYHFKALRIFPYKYDNSDYKKMLPKKFGTLLDKDFSNHLVKYIQEELDNGPQSCHTYLVGD